MAKKDGEHDPIGFGGLLRGLRDLLDLAAELPESEESSASAERVWESARGMVRAVQGWTIRVGVPPRIEPFGNLRHGVDGPVVDEVREPLVDLFTGDQALTLIVELPGVAEDQIKLDVTAEAVRVKARGEKNSYDKTIPLPCRVDPSSINKSFRHGLLELRLAKAGTGG